MALDPSTGRDAIAAAMVAADLAEFAPSAPSFGMPGFNATAILSDPADNDTSLAVHDFAATGPKEGTAGNLFSTEEAGGPRSAGSNMFGDPSDPSEPDFANSGNMFAGGFDMFGGQYDPGDPGTAQPNGPADQFGPGAIGNFGSNMTTGTPLGDYSTTPTMSTTPGVPSDPGDPFGNSDQIAEASPGSFTAGFAQGFDMAAAGFGGGDPGGQGADPGGGGGLGAVGGTEGSGSGDTSAGGVG